MFEEKKKILVIDDEPDERIYLAALLEANGYTTGMARDGNDGLEKAKADPPDLIALDIVMPEKSGVGFYREIRKDPDLGKIPIVLVTGADGLAVTSEQFHKFLCTRKKTAPPDRFIPKPLDQQELLEMVRRLLA